MASRKLHLVALRIVIPVLQNLATFAKQTRGLRKQLSHFRAPTRESVVSDYRVTLSADREEPDNDSLFRVMFQQAASILSVFRFLRWILSKILHLLLRLCFSFLEFQDELCFQVKYFGFLEFVHQKI